MKKYIILLSLIFFVSALYGEDTIKVGWIGPLTGGAAKWGAYKAAMLGVKDVNKNGGINGKKLELLFEDAHCNSATAISAFKKLTSFSKVSFILGGHCSPESLAIAPLAEKKKILALAAITSSPKLSDAGDYIFRVTPISTQLADLISPYAHKKLKIKKLALVYELTDYVIPVAERLNDLFMKEGGIVTSKISFNPGEVDFSSILIKASSGSPDAFYFGVQSPDTAILLIKKIREFKFNQKIFGNEQFGGAFYSAKGEDKKHLEGVTFAEAKCDYSIKTVKEFAKKYEKAYREKDLPFGCYTGEPYDTVQILSKAIAFCGENVDCVKQQLYKVRNYSGASGIISFNSKGDVDRDYVLRKIFDKKIVEIKS